MLFNCLDARPYSNSREFIVVLINFVILMCIDFRGLLKHWMLKSSVGLQGKRGICVLCSRLCNMYVIVIHIPFIWHPFNA